MSKLTFDSLFGDTDLDFDCPNCNHKITFKMNRVGSTIKCPNCSKEIILEENEDYSDTKTSLDESLNELNDLLKD
ncbi:hypothetical protein EXN54_20105 [Clostridium botulinum]|nr:hypothetical protein [Clostridium botulinum]NFA07599.1 hypothetical protein [Clostridium botulinum]NFA25804.1 hypothetical protein [Clostridium botulinum]NFB80997.1 hypothetical protein [Clostridium botulinum]NFB88853.1 hypothetical protein [Clostridium botulinum]